MKYLVYIFILCGISCLQKNIESINVTTYNAELIENDYMKKNITSKYSIGFYQSGERKFFIGNIGYSNNDTLFYNEIDGKKIEKGEFSFFYRGDSLTLVTRQSKDTTFYFSTTGLESFTQYEISDKKGNLLKSIDLLMNKEIIYTSYIFDDYVNPIYYIEKEECLSSSILDKDLFSAEIAKKKIEGQRIRIIEQEIKYYD